MKYQNVSFSVYPSRKYAENFDKIFGRKEYSSKPVRCRHCRKCLQVCMTEGTWHVACHAHEPEIMNESLAAVKNEAIERWNTANERP